MFWTTAFEISHEKKQEEMCNYTVFVITCIIILNGTHSFEFHSDVTCFHLEELPLEFLVRCVSKQ